MNPLLNREVIAQCCIILAACVGAWMMFIEPMAAEQQRLLEAVAESSREVDSIDQSAVEKLSRRAEGLRERIHEIEQAGRLGDDTSRLYGELSALGREHDVRIISISPGATSEAGRDSDLRRKRLEILLEAGYANVAAFLAELQSIEAYIRLESFTLLPRIKDGESIVHARVVCELLRFRIPEPLWQIRGVDDARE